MVAGCAGEQEPLIVLHAVPPEVEEDSCTWSADSSVHVASGRLDVAWGSLSSYHLAVVLLNNLLTGTTEGSNTGVEDGELQLESPVDITLRVPRDIVDRMGPGSDGEPLPLSFGVPIATDSLPPGARYVAGLDVVPAEYAEAFAAALEPGDEVQIVAEIVFSATRTGNSRGNLGVIEARAYEFPITLVEGDFAVACECNDAGECEPGTGVPSLLCGNAQDSFGASGLLCAPQEAGSSSDESSGAPMAASSSSGA